MEKYTEHSWIFVKAKNKTGAVMKALSINHFSSFEDEYSTSKIAEKYEEKVGKQMENWRKKRTKRPSMKNYTRRIIFFCRLQKWIMDILSKLLTVIGFFSVIVNGGDYVCRKEGRFLLLFFFLTRPSYRWVVRLYLRDYALQIGNIFWQQIGVSGCMVWWRKVRIYAKHPQAFF